MREVVVICLLILVMWGCGEEPDCDLSTPRNNIAVNFYDSEDSTTLFKKFIGISERATDSVFYNPSDSLASYNLNLNSATSQVTYVFVSSTRVDTLTLTYDTQLEWLSDECGPSFAFENLDVLGSSFSYEIVSTFIDVAIDENIKIYY